MGDIGLLEIFLLLILGILVFGGDLPAVGRRLGKIWGSVQRYIQKIQQDIEREQNYMEDQVRIDPMEDDAFIEQTTNTTDAPEYQSDDQSPSEENESEEQEESPSHEQSQS